MGNNYTCGNGRVYNYGIPVPSNLIVEYNTINTVCTVDDIYLPDVQIEWWIKINNNNWILHELSAVNNFITNIEVYGCRLEVKARCLKGGVYSGFCDPKVIEQVPLLFFSDQTGGIVGVTIDVLNIAVGGRINIDWGDGTNNDYNGNNAAIFHNYPDTLDYQINISGDLNALLNLQILNQVGNHGLLNQWILPRTDFAMIMYFTACNFTGIPRGDFLNMLDLNMNQNACNITEVSAFLYYLSNFYVGVNLPVRDTTFTLDGAGMGAPNAEGVLCINNIQAKFIVAGFTATIITN